MASTKRMADDREDSEDEDSFLALRKSTRRSGPTRKSTKNRLRQFDRGERVKTFDKKDAASAGEDASDEEGDAKESTRPPDYGALKPTPPVLDDGEIGIGPWQKLRSQQDAQFMIEYLQEKNRSLMEENARLQERAEKAEKAHDCNTACSVAQERVRDLKAVIVEKDNRITHLEHQERSLKEDLAKQNWAVWHAAMEIERVRLVYKLSTAEPEFQLIRFLNSERELEARDARIETLELRVGELLDERREYRDVVNHLHNYMRIMGEQVIEARKADTNHNFDDRIVDDLNRQLNHDLEVRRSLLERQDQDADTIDELRDRERMHLYEIGDLDRAVRRKDHHIRELREQRHNLTSWLCYVAYDPEQDCNEVGNIVTDMHPNPLPAFTFTTLPLWASKRLEIQRRATQLVLEHGGQARKFARAEVAIVVQQVAGGLSAVAWESEEKAKNS